MWITKTKLAEDPFAKFGVAEICTTQQNIVIRHTEYSIRNHIDCYYKGYIYILVYRTHSGVYTHVLVVVINDNEREYITITIFQWVENMKRVCTIYKCREIVNFSSFKKKCRMKIIGKIKYVQ